MAHSKPRLWRVLYEGTTFEVKCIYALEAIQFITGLKYVRTHQAEWYPDRVEVGNVLCWLD